MIKMIGYKKGDVFLELLVKSLQSLGLGCVGSGIIQYCVYSVIGIVCSIEFGFSN